ncbi:RsmB/NOP family class I SAM-dependent RNA methyltransferase [Roseobacteraceae bacterium S113]
MTPGARIQAAIECLDAIADGMPAEQALTRWARASRFAGSKDRAAVRDHVFAAVRRWRSSAAVGGADTGRGRMIGLCRQDGIDPASLFNGQGHAPAPLTDAEMSAGETPHGAVACDLPDWAYARLVDEMGDKDAETEALALRRRAPVDLRVNTLKSNMSDAQELLRGEGIETDPHPLAATALRVREGARRVARSAAYTSGAVELQDVASQAVIAAIPELNGPRVMDYCAGGGGKALALAARFGCPIEAHDAAPDRMRNLPERAARAGAQITLRDKPGGPYDLVLCDVPCSGTGAWRRAPDAKWRLGADELEALLDVQQAILSKAVALVAPGGMLVYATCSLFASENADQVARFLDKDVPVTLEFARTFRLSDGGDGFFVAVMRRA